MQLSLIYRVAPKFWHKPNIQLLFLYLKYLFDFPYIVARYSYDAIPKWPFNKTFLIWNYDPKCAPKFFSKARMVSRLLSIIFRWTYLHDWVVLELIGWPNHLSHRPLLGLKISIKEWTFSEWWLCKEILLSARHHWI